VQLNGAGNDQTSGVTYSSEILRRFGEAFGATIQHFPVPAFFDNPDTKAMLWEERSTQRVLSLHNKMDIALFGLGTPHAEIPSQVYIGGYLTDADIAQLAVEKIVGDVATVFFREDGGSSDIPLNRRSSGPSLDVIKKAPRRLCVVAGMSRLPALTGALNAGIITDLIVDDGTARALVAN
jgi:deoxyribonucleoside regulator